MARFYGRVGYGESIEKAPGVWVDNIVEVSYFGDVVRNARELREGENLNSDLSVQNSISIVADEYANDHFFAIRYVEWAGVLWTVSSVEVQSPRLLLRLGEVYNGPKSATLVTPVEPTFVDSSLTSNATVTVATTPGVIYKNENNGDILTEDVPFVMPFYGFNLIVKAIPESDEFYFAEGQVDQWTYIMGPTPIIPLAPTFTGSDEFNASSITVIYDDKYAYGNMLNDEEIPPDIPYEIAPGSSLHVRAMQNYAQYYIPSDVVNEWYYENGS